MPDPLSPLHRDGLASDGLSSDGNVDLEDATTLAGAPRADVDQALTRWAEVLEPAARRYLQALLLGRSPNVPNRILLAPHPAGASPTLYQPRSEVIALQDALGTLGESVVSDGLYGPGTARAVAAVQGRLELPATGIVDSRTLIAMNRALLPKGAPLLDLSPRARIRPDQVLAASGHCTDETAARLCEALRTLSSALNAPKLSPGSGSENGGFDNVTASALGAFQEEALLPRTGLLCTATRDALNVALAAIGKPPLVVSAPTSEEKVELHFYPGEKVLRVVEDGRVVGAFGMVGGRPEGKDDPNNPLVDYSRSPAGSYDVVEVSPHASTAWAWSYVPYGAALREAGGEVEFRDVDGTWRLATGPRGVFAGRNPGPLAANSYREDNGTLMGTWRANDFGHLRGRLRAVGGGLQTHMIHPSGFNENTEEYFADTSALLDPEVALDRLHWSHGCEHVHPRDFDMLVARGWLRPGSRFVVHDYEERAPLG